MRLSPDDHTRHDWVVHKIASDFRLLDVWRLPATGARQDFGALCDLMLGLDHLADDGSRASRALFWLRRAMGRMFGWDDQAKALPIPGCSETTLRSRLPRKAQGGPMADTGSEFQVVYRMDCEWAAEISNGTVHAIMHLGWVPEGDHHRGQMAVYVKPRNAVGRAYMALISPFRHFIVYPAMLRRIARVWRGRHGPRVLEARA